MACYYSLKRDNRNKQELMNKANATNRGCVNQQRYKCYTEQDQENSQYLPLVLVPDENLEYHERIHEEAK